MCRLGRASILSEVVYGIIGSIPVGATLWSMCIFATFSDMPISLAWLRAHGEGQSGGREGRLRRYVTITCVMGSRGKSTFLKESTGARIPGIRLSRRLSPF